MIRYAGDFIILCRSHAEAQTALAEVAVWVKEAGLVLHSEQDENRGREPTRRVRLFWAGILSVAGKSRAFQVSRDAKNRKAWSTVRGG
jgi:hypothetical protein